MNFRDKEIEQPDRSGYKYCFWQNPQGLEIRKIAETCSVSERTAYRDLKALESELNAPIWEEGTKRGTVKGHFLPPSSFSLEEATTILLAARMMQNYFHLYDLGMTSTFMKLNNFPSYSGDDC